jgi:putative peptidoglycan lipid II flippase
MPERNRVAYAAGLLMVATILSRILGYIRDVVIYARFGQNRITDAYQAAFSIPDFLYLLLVGGALSSAFIPVLSSYLANNKENEAWKVSSIIFNIIMLLMLGATTLGLIFTPQLMRLLVPGFEPESLNLTIKLSRIMFVQTFFMALNGISMGILNSYKHFLAPAVGSVLYNLGIILVGLWLSRYWGIAGFSVGVVAGAVIYFMVQLPALLRIGLNYHFSLNLRHPGVQQIGRLIIPVFIGLSVTQLNLFVSQNLASSLTPGLVAALRTAQRLMQLPIGIFAIAIAVAVFPTLTEQAARKEKDSFKTTMSLGIRSVIFITMPAAAGLIALGVPIVRLLFEQGQFTWAATQATAYALGFYAIGLFSYAVLQVLNRVFYALHDTKTPVSIGILTIVLNTVLNFLLVNKLAHGGLALAYSVAGIFNVLVLLFILRLRIGTIFGTQLLACFIKSVLASVIMGVVSYATAQYLAGFLNLAGKTGQFFQVGGAIGVGISVYGFLVLALKMEEAELVWDIFKRRFHRRRR